jgi:hypothetical protein
MNDDMSGLDMGALEKMAASAPRLAAGLDGKLRAAPKVEEPTDQDKIAWALAKAVAEAEGKFIHRALKRLIPKEIYYPAEDRLNGGDGFTMKKLLNEYDIKIVLVQPSREQAAVDFENGIQRRHLQITKAGTVKREHVWEWSRAG